MSDWVPPDHKRCNYLWANGNQCRQVREEGAEHGFCPGHYARVVRESRPIEPPPEHVAEEMLPPDFALDTAAGVNAALTRIFRLVAQGRLAPRHANSLAYYCQLSLSTLPALRQEGESSSGSSLETIFQPKPDDPIAVRRSKEIMLKLIRQEPTASEAAPAPREAERRDATVEPLP